MCCLQDISLQVGNLASCVIMGDNGQVNVHCRFVDENDLSHLNIQRFILKLDRKFSGLDKNLEEKVWNYYGHHVWIEFRDLCELNHWIVHLDVLQCHVNSDLLVMRKTMDSPRSGQVKIRIVLVIFVARGMTINLEGCVKKKRKRNWVVK